MSPKQYDIFGDIHGHAHALAVMGNHEFNAIAYHTPTADGISWLCSHNFNHHKQHQNLAHEWVLKGKELNLPEGCSFKDHVKHSRSDVRTCWFKNPDCATYRHYIFPYPEEIDCLDTEVATETLDKAGMNRETGIFTVPIPVPFSLGIIG